MARNDGALVEEFERSQNRLKSMFVEIRMRRETALIIQFVTEAPKVKHSRDDRQDRVQMSVGFGPLQNRIKDQGSYISVSGPRVDAIMVAIQTAKEKGWHSLTVKGSEKFRRRAWLIGQVFGMKIHGYEPTAAELELKDRLRNQIKDRGLDTEANGNMLEPRRQNVADQTKNPAQEDKTPANIQTKEAIQKDSQKKLDADSEPVKDNKTTKPENRQKDADQVKRPVQKNKASTDRGAEKSGEEPTQKEKPKKGRGFDAKAVQLELGVDKKAAQKPTSQQEHDTTKGGRS